MEKKKKKERGGESEVCGGAEGDGFDYQMVSVKEEQKCCAVCDGAGNRPGSFVAEQGEGGAGNGEENREEWQISQG